MNRLSRVAVLACLVAGIAGLAGCSQSAVPSPGTIQDARRHMNKIAAIYGDYLSSHNNAPPKTADDFRKYVEANPDQLKIYNVLSVDELLTSKRDGKPFILVTGTRRAPADSPATPWAAYEETGADGNQMAVSVRGGARELTPEEIAREFGAK